MQYAGSAKKKWAGFSLQVWREVGAKMSSAGEADFDLYEDLEDPFFPVNGGRSSEEVTSRTFVLLVSSPVFVSTQTSPPLSTSTASVRKEELEALKEQVDNYVFLYTEG